MKGARLPPPSLFLSLPPFLPLCLAGTEEAFYHFSFFFFTQKNLISIQHASPAHCIQSRVITIQSACVCACMCVRACVCVCLLEGDRQRQAGRIPLCSLWILKVTYSWADPRQPPSVRQWCYCLSECLGWGCIYKKKKIFSLMDAKASPAYVWPDVCWIIDLEGFLVSLLITCRSAWACFDDVNFLRRIFPHQLRDNPKGLTAERGWEVPEQGSLATSRFLWEIAVMFDTQFPWQPATVVHLTYIRAVCTQTR